MLKLISASSALIAAICGLDPRGCPGQDSDDSLDGTHWHNWACSTVDVLMLARFGSYEDAGIFVDSLLSEDVVTACAIICHLKYMTQGIIGRKCDRRSVIREVNRRAKSPDDADAREKAKALLRWARKVHVHMNESGLVIVGGY